MKFRTATAIWLALGAAVPAVAQTPNLAPGEDRAARLDDIMEAAQARHAKLWFAGRQRNWDLAGFELAQLKARLIDAATLYPGLPVTDFTTMAKPVEAIAGAIAARDGAGFARGFAEMTAGCNACHRTMERGFIAMKVPDTTPFGNQSFAPSGK
jgi:hypothetical protein